MTEPAWVDLRSEHGDYVDVVRTGAHHSLGDLDCWCKPSFEIVPSPGREKPVILIKHNAPPHSFVSGEMKAEAMDDSAEFFGAMEYHEGARDDPNTMICECCGVLDSDHEAGEPCVGPGVETIQWIDEDGGSDDSYGVPNEEEPE